MQDWYVETPIASTHKMYHAPFNYARDMPLAYMRRKAGAQSSFDVNQVSAFLWNERRARVNREFLS